MAKKATKNEKQNIVAQKNVGLAWRKIAKKTIYI